MAEPKKAAAAAAAKAEDQAIPAAKEAQAAQPPGLSGPTVGELEERAINLEAENQILREQIAMIMRRLPPEGSDARQAPPAAAVPADVPVLDESEPFGLVVGDHEAAFIQNGHQFGRDKRYLRTEAHRGSPRAFNPKLVGVVKGPRLAPQV